MNEMTLEGLLRAGYSYYARNVANFMIIEVQVGNSRPEIIINPRENFEAKLHYYSKAYDQSLRLKANPDIRIVRYNFVETLRQYFTPQGRC